MGPVVTRSYTREADLTSAVLAEVRKLPRVKAWRRNVGRRGRVRFGIVGEADIQGVIGPHGHMFAIETKQPGEQLTADQVKWRDEVVALGVTHIVATTLESAIRPVVELLSRNTERASSEDQNASERVLLRRYLEGR